MTAQNWISIAAILSAIFAYFLKNFVFEPLLELRKVRGRIQNRLKYHSNIITNGEFPADVIKPIRDELRQLSCDLEEAYFAIVLRRWFPAFLNVPKGEDVSEVARQLIFLSNSTGNSRHIMQNDEAMNKIKEKLRII